MSVVIIHRVNAIFVILVRLEVLIPFCFCVCACRFIDGWSQKHNGRQIVPITVVVRLCTNKSKLARTSSCHIPHLSATTRELSLVPKFAKHPLPTSVALILFFIGMVFVWTNVIPVCIPSASVLFVVSESHDFTHHHTLFTCGTHPPRTTTRSQSTRYNMLTGQVTTGEWTKSPTISERQSVNRPLHRIKVV